jgi:arylsulfatase A
MPSYIRILADKSLREITILAHIQKRLTMIRRTAGACLKRPQALLLLIFSLLISSGGSVRASRPAVETDASLPNILILYADDLGFGDLGCYHSKSKIPTPNLDRLAAEGMRFTDGHSSSGICTPSRYALLTGRHHWRDFHGIVNALGGSVFKPEQRTLPEMLKAKGYHTNAIGKWHLGWDWDAIKKEGAKPTGEGRKTTWGPEAFNWSKPIPDGPLAHGFDHYIGDTFINFPPYCWIEDDRVPRAPDTVMDSSKWKPIKEGNWECRPGPMISDWDPYQNIPTTTQRGIEYIKSQATEQSPFFLYFAFPAPHAPIIPNDEFDGKSQAGPYGDLVVETDDACGRLLKALEETGQGENTVVIFTADNGPEKYAYARDEKFGHWSAHPLRGLKRDIYEGGHHVPYLVKWPGITKAGRVSDALVSQIDIMATLAAAVGADLPDDAAEDSHNLLPILRGQTNQVRTTHVHNTRENQYAIRHGDWLLINHKDGYMSGRNKAWETRHKYAADNKSPVELYNLKNDIGQRNDLAGKQPERVAELQALLSRIRKQGYSAPRLSHQ